MADMKRHLIDHSVEDVVRILENVPVIGDMIAERPFIETMNRVSLAHLSIERTMKFLIEEAGQTYAEDHHLPLHLEKLRQCEPETVKFLEEAFADAVRHYRFNINARGLGHLKSLEEYLKVTGSREGFDNVRYWEINQSLLVRGLSLNLHLELLHALREVLMSPESKRSKRTVQIRVEGAVIAAINKGIRCFVGSEKESAVSSYVEWVKNLGFENHRDAIAVAFKEGLATGHDYTARVVRSAQQELLNSADPAVKYLADTLDVLPRQPRDVIPCVEWLGPIKEQSGFVKTPAGTHLGTIERRRDGLWTITPARDGLIKVAAKAGSQTDARCYLAALLTRPVQVTVDGRTETRRVVTRGDALFHHARYVLPDDLYDSFGALSDQIYEVVFWNKDHGLEVQNAVEVELPEFADEATFMGMEFPEPAESPSSLFQIIKGIVTNVAEHVVAIKGSEVWDVRPRDEYAP